MIIYRVAIGRGWTQNTMKGMSMVSTLRFEPGPNMKSQHVSVLEGIDTRTIPGNPDSNLDMDMDMNSSNAEMKDQNHDEKLDVEVGSIRDAHSSSSIV